MIEAATQTLMCLFIIGACAYSIRSENRRSKQLDEMFNRLKAKWKDDKDFPK